MVPGLYCPGLIEAWSFAAVLSTSVRFRGSIAPASLKQEVLAEIAGEPCRVPGLYCPGLIEAPTALVLLLRCSNGSGALLPRPH